MSEDAEADEPATPDHHDTAEPAPAGATTERDEQATRDTSAAAGPGAPADEDEPGDPAQPVAAEPAAPEATSEPAGDDDPPDPNGEAGEPTADDPDAPAQPADAGPAQPTGADTLDEPDDAADPAPTTRPGATANTGPPDPDGEAGEPTADNPDAPAHTDDEPDDAADPAPTTGPGATADSGEDGVAGDDGEGAGPTPATGGRPRQSALVRWILPIILAATAAASAFGAITLNADEASSAVGDRGAATTPLLSARRAPEVLAEPVAGRRLGTDLQAWLAQSPPDTCLVVDDAGQHVFEHNPAAPLAGASTQKLLTSTALLLALGADARLETAAVAGDEPSRGVIDGHLYVVGGGDALLATRSWRDHFRRQPRTIDDIEQLAQAIVDAGVTRITGSVIGDASRYESTTYHPAWPRRFFDDREIGPIGGLMVNDGFASFPSAATPGAPTLPSTNVGADAANILTLALRVRGVEVVGPPRSGEAPEDAAEVATLPSLPIRDIVAQMLTDSDNETAEAALKEVGHAESGEGSWAAGAAAATDLLSGAGVTMDGVEVVDGSGLSDRNQLTCTTLVDVLTNPDTGQVVREGLAVAGETGTLATRYDGTAAEGRLRAKTGTLRNVTALAGEIDVADGDTVTFAYVANVPDPNQVSSDQVGLLGLADLLMRYPEGVDMAALQPAAATPPDPAG